MLGGCGIRADCELQRPLFPCWQDKSRVQNSKFVGHYAILRVLVSSNIHDHQKTVENDPIYLKIQTSIRILCLPRPYSLYIFALQSIMLTLDNIINRFLD